MIDYIERDKLLAKFIEGDGDDEFTEGYNFAVNEHRDKLKAMPAADVQPVDRWTSVDEALPEKDGYYLVVKECEICEGLDIAEYSENRWHKHDRVIYWQPLPDLPEAIKED